MFYLSQLKNIKVADKSGDKVGTLVDLVASLREKYPLVTALIVKVPKLGNVRVPWSQVRGFEESRVLLTEKPDGKGREASSKSEILLIKNVLDKQIVDTEGHKLIRVQDIQLARVDSRIRVIAVDISGRAVLRRLGLSGLARAAPPRKGSHHHYIDWSNVDLISSGTEAVKLKVSHDRLSLLHPADIADIVNELNPESRVALLELLSKEVAADTMEEMSPSHQANVLRTMDPKKASDLLKEMEPDDAADVLADLPDEKTAELLSLVNKEEAEELRQLLAHPEDSAGGIMTTEYVALPANLTVQRAIQRLRKFEPDAETIYYLYVIDKDERLLGVLSLRRMIFARPNVKISELMNINVIKVNVSDEQKDVVKLMAKYNLLAMPVVDDENRIQGIITVDDAIDVVIPAVWKRRFSHVYR